jgi:adenylyltransferase/sulfurtransferase
MNELNPGVDAILLCNIGTRSVFAIQALREAGYTGRLFNLKDGVNGWSRDVDSRLPRY